MLFNLNPGSGTPLDFVECDLIACAVVGLRRARRWLGRFEVHRVELVRYAHRNETFVLVVARGVRLDKRS